MMANYTGRRVYPIQTDFTPARDAGVRVVHAPTGLPRGGTDPDYNVTLRCLGQRVDKKPKKPY